MLKGWDVKKKNKFKELSRTYGYTYALMLYKIDDVMELLKNELKNIKEDHDGVIRGNDGYLYSSVYYIREGLKEIKDEIIKTRKKMK
jgi:hypothetical protein